MTTTPPNLGAQRPGEKSIGDIIRHANNLSPDQVEQVLVYQRQHNVKFGEAAVALGLAKREDVLWALSQQFHYPYSGSGSSKVSAELVAASNPFSESAEAFRDLRSQLIGSVFGTEGRRRAVAVVSANTGDGKSYFAANVAVAFSQLGGRTLLVDADMRTPRQHEIFGIESTSGLSGILSGRSETNVIRPAPELPSLYLLPVGVTPPNPLELVQRPAFGLLMNELMAKFDYVIVDTPAASHGSDARVIAGACGAAVVVGRRGNSRIDAIQKLVTSVKKTSAQVAGVIVNEF
ncbi:MAG: polysaccharide biosynthesis tyrosine autokinase [Burkholderiales bacterium]|nr:polysaccharide biosynthesis tyrosine autokinase [Burkholderiales bacterium]